MPHALRCEAYIVQSEMSDGIALRLLAKMSRYCQQRIRYEDALRIYKVTLRVTRLMFGNDYTNVITALHNVEKLCRAMGRKEEAESYLEEAKTLRILLQEKAEAIRNRQQEKADAIRKRLSEKSKSDSVPPLNTQSVSQAGQGRLDKAIEQRSEAV